MELVQAKIERLKSELEENDHGWVVDGCDAMLWEGKYRAVVGGGNVDAAKLEKGRWGRRPVPCWANGEDLGSKTTWSRDMGLGFMFWMFRTGNLDNLVEHGNYGKKKNWKMGEPFADGRVYYTPNMIGTLFRAIKKMGGDSDLNILLPSSYPSGLEGFHAHLLVLRIALNGTSV